MSIKAIFFDLRKAFDVVNHDILLKKQIYYKFDARLMNWIKSYLSNRKQHIVHKHMNFSDSKIRRSSGFSTGPSIVSSVH